MVTDVETLRRWKGSFGGGKDYEKACKSIGQQAVGSLDGHTLIWDIGGPGTAFLTSFDSDGFSMVRFWSDDELSDDKIRELQRLAVPASTRATFQLLSSPAVVMWACEESTDIVIPSEPEGVPHGDWSMGGTVYYFPLSPGEYVVGTGTFESDQLSLVSLSCRRASETAAQKLD